jgi:hypothetical protein
MPMPNHVNHPGRLPYGNTSSYSSPIAIEAPSGQVEHLAHLGGGDRGARQAPPATTALAGHVHD